MQLELLHHIYVECVYVCHCVLLGCFQCHKAV